MNNLYAQSRAATKVASFAVLLVLVAVIAFNYEQNVLLITTVAAAVLLLVHFVLTRSASLLLLVVLFAQSVTALIIGEGAAINFGDMEVIPGINATLVQLIILSCATFQIATYTAVAYLYSHGRMWINLLVAFFIFNTTLLSTGFINLEFLPLAGVGSWVLGLVFLFCRAYTRKKNRMVIKKYPISDHQSKQINKLFPTLTVSSLRSEEDWGAIHFLAWDERRIFAIHMLTAKDQVQVNQNGLLADSKNMNQLLEQMKYEIHAHRKSIPARRVIPMVITPTDSVFIQKIITINISKWRQPDHSWGDTVILTPTKAKTFTSTQNKAPKLLNRHLKLNIFK